MGEVFRFNLELGRFMNEFEVAIGDDGTRIPGAGALQGVEGLITRKKGACRLILSIALIHQSVAVEIDSSLLEILPPVPVAGRSEVKASGSIDNYRQLVAKTARNRLLQPVLAP